MAPKKDLLTIDILSQPLVDFQKDNPDYPTNLAVGAIIVRPPDPPNPEPTALILQRVDSDSFGGKWDIPGGGVDPQLPNNRNKSTTNTTPHPNNIDTSITSALTREVHEETGLHVSHILAPIHYHEWESGFLKWLRRVYSKGLLWNLIPGAGTEYTSTGVIREAYTGKFVFLVQVEELSIPVPQKRNSPTSVIETETPNVTIRLAAKEHQKYRWITASDAKHSMEKWDSRDRDGRNEFLSREDLVGVVEGLSVWEERYGGGGGGRE